MRIALVVHGYPPLEVAGVELVAREHAVALAGRGHEVHVFARDYRAAAPGAVRDERVDGIAVRRATPGGASAASFADLYDGDGFSAAFRDFLREVRPEVVHFQHLVMLSLRLLYEARDAGVPSVLSLHDAYYLCHRLFLLDREGRRCPGPDGGLRCADCLAELGAGDQVGARFDAMARALAVPAALIAPSRSLAARYEAEMPFLAGRIEVLDPGMARAPERRGDRCRGRGMPGAPLRLLFVGPWLPHKGLDLLVDAVAALEPSRYCLAIHGTPVVGSEGYVERLREATRGLPVDWRGSFSAGELTAVLDAADVLVLPSRCDESYSRVVREARAAGLAVVGPATGGPAEVLADGRDALLVAPGSSDALLAALRRLLDDPVLARRLAEAPARWPTVEDAARDLESLYERVVAPGATPAAAARAGGDFCGRRPPWVSVAYVTKNGEELLDESLAAVRAQRGAFELAEILAVDSGSSDATLEILARHGARVLRIPSREFGHGRTRNLAAREAIGDVVAFLTQDACPARDDWLDHLVRPLADDPLLAGTWSRHLPRPGCHPMECRKVEEFPLFQGAALRVVTTRGRPEGSAPSELDVWFSNNASAIRRTVLERWPFPDVEFGEDQAWARLVLAAGFRTALANDSLVFHSHAYGPWTSFQRHFDHARAMARDFGWADDLTPSGCLRAALRETRHDVAYWAERQGRGRARVAVRWALPAIAYHLGAFGGRFLGARSRSLPAGLSRHLSLLERLRAADRA